MVTTDQPDRWLLIAITHTGGMHLLFDGVGDEARSLRDALTCTEKGTSPAAPDSVVIEIGAARKRPVPWG